jgi:hypothetical protein
MMYGWIPFISYVNLSIAQMKFPHSYHRFQVLDIYGILGMSWVEALSMTLYALFDIILEIKDCDH